MDARNRIEHHLIVATIVAIFVLLFHLAEPTGFDLAKSFARTSFFLLFITLSIGPLMRIRKSASVMLPMRGEFGIWFAITALIHGILMARRGGLEIIGTNGFGLAVLAGLIALFWALVLASTSSGKAIRFLGPENWKWLHGFSYVIFYLVSIHIIYFLFLSPMATGKPSRYIILFMILTIPVLQISAFIKKVIEYQRKS